MAAWRTEKLDPQTPPVYKPVHKFKFLTVHPDLNCQYQPEDFLK